MTNFMSNGLSWLQTMRETHCTQEILVGFIKNEAVAINATPTSDDAISTQNRVTVQRQTFNFVVRRYDLELNSIKLQRGLKIWYKNDEYELAFENKDIYEYNDPDRNDIVLKTTLVSDSKGIHP